MTIAKSPVFYHEDENDVLGHQVWMFYYRGSNSYRIVKATLTKDDSVCRNDLSQFMDRESAAKRFLSIYKNFVDKGYKINPLIINRKPNLRNFNAENKPIPMKKIEGGWYNDIEE